MHFLRTRRYVFCTVCATCMHGGPQYWLAASISAWACGFERLNSHAANGNTAVGLAHCCDMDTIIILAVARKFEAGLAELDGRANRAARAAQRAQWWILDVVRRQQAPQRADQLARARCRHPTTWAPLACFLRAAGIADGAVHIWTTGNATVTPRARTQVCTSCQLLRCSAPLLTPAYWPSCLLTNCPVCSTDATSGDNCCGFAQRFGSRAGRGGLALRCRGTTAAVLHCAHRQRGRPWRDGRKVASPGWESRFP